MTSPTNAQARPNYTGYLLAIIALALSVLAISSVTGRHNTAAAATTAPAAAQRAVTTTAAPQTTPAVACTLRSDVDVSLVTGWFSYPPASVSHDSMNHGETCIWDGPNSTVGADILASVQIGNPSALENAYQAQLRFSRNWAHNSPTLGETVTELTGHVSAYEITDTATHSLAVVTVDPDLGLVVRYTTAHDTPKNRAILESWAA